MPSYSDIPKRTARPRPHLRLQRERFGFLLTLGAFAVLSGACFVTPARATSDAKTEAGATADQIAFFEGKIRPLLVANCYTCHSANTNSRGGLRVDDRNGLLIGGNGGPAVIPGDPDESLLIQAVKHDGIVMPPKKHLTDEEIAHLTKWVQDGAAWPQEKVNPDYQKTNAKYEQLRKTHWSWQPLRPMTPPEPKDASWARTAVDKFVLSALESNQRRPVADADKVTLIRRASFDLTGLPPTPEEIRAFTEDASPDAFAKVVDRLLASTAFGERWGRHWLDVARYGESTGSSRNLPYPHAWRYRDYVINSFNKDKPYDEFLHEQIAGDLLPSSKPEITEERLVATGFLALGVKDVNQRFKVRFVMDNVDEQIDTASRAILGLTVSCARCHDHKFDPIPTREYYALAGIFESTDILSGLRNKMGGGGLDYYDTDKLCILGEAPGGKAVTPKHIEEAKAKVKAAQAEFIALRDGPDGKTLAENGRPKQFNARQKTIKLQKELLELTDPVARGAKVAVAVRDAAKIVDSPIRIRGEAERHGPIAPRGVLTLFTAQTPVVIPSHQSGRLELAHWLTDPENPLTPRVFVNRVWRHLFGQGLVRSVDNFGVTGDKPSHPLLLDYLAVQFRNDQWSVKTLIRSIVLSRTYQLASATAPELRDWDPENRWLSRHGVRRLDGEELRDGMLAVADQLDRTPGKGSPGQDFQVQELRNNGPEARDLLLKARTSKQRSIYLPLLRGITPDALDLFDYANPGLVTGQRANTNVAPQALYFLNDPGVRTLAQSWAEAVLKREFSDDNARIESVYRAVFGRAPTAKEQEQARQFLTRSETLARTQAQEAAAAPPVAVPVPTPPPAKVAGAGATPTTRPTPILDPDQIVEAEAPVDDAVPPPANPKIAAWMQFCQALLASAEFRYLP